MALNATLTSVELNFDGDLFVIQDKQLDYIGFT